MSEVKRYGYDTVLGVIEAENGVKPEWIKASDYEALMQKLDAVVAELSVVDAIHDECVFITDYDYDSCPKSVRKIIRRLAVMQIPATDTILNAVRAEGVSAFVKQYAGNLRAAGGAHGHYQEPYHDMADHIEAKCELYIDQLRADAAKDGSDD